LGIFVRITNLCNYLSQAFEDTITLVRTWQFIHLPIKITPAIMIVRSTQGFSLLGRHISDNVIIAVPLTIIVLERLAGLVV
jgi:hypothetical protein